MQVFVATLVLGVVPATLNLRQAYVGSSNSAWVAPPVRSIAAIRSVGYEQHTCLRCMSWTPLYLVRRPMVAVPVPHYRTQMYHGDATRVIRARHNGTAEETDAVGIAHTPYAAIQWLSNIPKRKPWSACLGCKTFWFVAERAGL